MKFKKIAIRSLIPTVIAYILFNIIWIFIDAHNKALFMLTGLGSVATFAFTFFYQLNHYIKKEELEI